MIKELEEYKEFFKKEEIAAKTTLLQEGQVSKTAYIIEKGCIRSWFNNNGKDITFQFFFEGESVASVESFMTNQPSLYSLESLEPCIINSISRKDFEFILDNSPLIKQEVEKLVFKRLFYYQQLALSRIKNNPQMRYEELMEQRPEILQRVPQHYIASFLGITPVSLSRIRNRR
jgi:CRP-like cAMP-binding protein